MRRQVVWNNGPEYDFTKVPKKKTKHASTTSMSACTRQEARSRSTESDVNKDQDVRIIYPSTVTVDPPAIEETIEETAIQSSLPLGSFTSYISQIQEESAITICDSSVTVFALPDFDVHHSKLTVSKYHIVERCVKTVQGSCQWIYCCSCSRREQELVMSLATGITAGSSRIYKNYCIHIRAVVDIVNNFDVRHSIEPNLNDGDHNYNIASTYADVSLPTVQTDEVFDIFGDDVFCIRCDSPSLSYGILHCSGKITCLTCRYGSHSCVHVNQLQKLLESEDKIVSLSLLDTLQAIKNSLSCDKKLPGTVRNPACISRQEIHFNVSPGQLTNTPGYSPHKYCQDNGTVKLDSMSVNENCCPRCSAQFCDKVAGEEMEGWQCSTIPLFTRTLVFEAKVYHKTCNSCGHSLPFDGRAEAILNMGTFLISHDLLRDYMYHFLQTGMTMFAYHQTWCKHMADAGVTNQLTYNKFRLSWHSFVELLDIHYDDGFMCPLCGPLPKVVICDGTALSFRRELMPSMVDESGNDKGSRATGR